MIPTKDNTKDILKYKGKTREYPTQESVNDFFDFEGSPEFAQDFFDHYNSQDWKSGNGQNITNWQSKAKLWIKKEMNKQKEVSYGRKPKGSVDFEATKRELATITKRNP